MEKIVIVDHDPLVREMLARRLEHEGFACVLAGDHRSALEEIEADGVALLVAELNLAEVDGLELLRAAKLADPDLAAVVVAAVPDVERAVAAMRLGAYDYIAKPFDPDDAIERIRQVLERRRLDLQGRKYQEELEKRIQERTEQLSRKNRALRKLFLGIIRTLIHTVEARDHYTMGHSRRIADYAVTLAKHLELAPKEVEDLRLAGLLHDIGKIGVQDSVLNKPGSLTAQEYEHVKTHPLTAVRILASIPELEEVIPPVHHHHERYDGRGYPDRLAGEEIPPGARILAVADAYDAMTTNRPHHQAFQPMQARQEVKRCEGSQFDPRIAEAFLAMPLPEESPSRAF